MGLSFKTAPVDLRERVSLAVEQVPAALEALRAYEGVDGAVVLSTCNRFEVFADAKTDRQGADALQAFMKQAAGGHPQLGESAYLKRESAAFEHIVRVACSLDSQVLGEAQILGQVKRAFELAAEAGACTESLTNLLKRAIHAGKRVHEETAIGAESISLSTTALKAAASRVEDFASCSILLLGAGEMARLAAAYLREKGAANVTVVSRTPGNAQRLAESVGGRALPFDMRHEAMAKTDVAFVAVRGETPAICADELHAQRVLAGRRMAPLLIIDQGMPRNVEPACGKLDRVELMDLDALNREMDASRAARQKAAVAAERIAAAEVEAFATWYQQRFVAPTIKDIYAKAESAGSREVERARKALAKEAGRPLTAAETEILQMMAESIVKKVLHGPTVRLRKEAGRGGSSYYTSAARYLFGLDSYPVIDGVAPVCSRHCGRPACEGGCTSVAVPAAAAAPKGGADV